MSMPKKAILIFTEAQTFGLASIARLEDAQKLVGGLIERATILPNGDEVYVNEEGLLCSPQHFFEINGEVFAGNAYVVGEVLPNGDNSPFPKSSVKDIIAQTKFLTADQIRERYK